MSVEMLLHRTCCHVSLPAFSGGKCRACLALPEVPASDLPAPDAPPSSTSPLCLIAKPFLEPSPNHGPVLGRDCRCEFRQARSRAPLPDGVLAVGGATDGVWQCGSVMSTLRRGPCRASRHDRGRRETPRDPRCDRAETLAEPGIPATAAGILLRHHRNPLPRGWRRGGRRCSCSSSAARAETLSDRQEDLRDHRRKPPLSLRKKSSATPNNSPAPRDHPRLQKTVITHRKILRTPKKSQKTMKIWLKEQKMFFWPYHRGGGIFIFL